MNHWESKDIVFQAFAAKRVKNSQRNPIPGISFADFINKKPTFAPHQTIKEFMGKSQETFGKKDKEKRRLKQRQEKAEKMQERKANTKKGKSLDDMMAYLDENGNISSTPPDPMKKKVFKQEDMQIGVPKQEARDLQAIRTGTVTFFNHEKGFGFIKDSQTQESVFVHINQLSGPVKENDKLTFEVEMGFKGPSAVNVKKAG